MFIYCLGPLVEDLDKSPLTFDMYEFGRIFCLYLVNLKDDLVSVTDLK